MRKVLLLALMLTSLTSFLSAQNTVKGKVFDDQNGEPLIGASVILKGTTIGTITEWDGSFVIKSEMAYPVTLEVSYVGYQTKDVVFVNDNMQSIEIGTDAEIIQTIEVRGRRITEKQKESPLTVESLDLIAIKETPSVNFYDGLGSLKEVDLTAASMGFKVINMRGFNSTSPVRSLQIIDGVDNQSPGLNFSLGNFLGSSELDVNKVELVIGASSAFYGPNAFNGVINMETKDPFYHTGISVISKVGERSLLEGGIRWADAFQNKKGKDIFAFKLNVFGMKANDWEADNYEPTEDSPDGVSNPGRFDAVNIYGDEYYSGNDFSTFDPWTYGGLETWYRTGYKEKDLVDYDSKNYKANAAFHFRLKPSIEEKSPELIYSSSFGSGTTVYQGDNRFSLRNIQFYQNRLELRKRDKYFIRVYSTHEDAGDSYDPYFTALALQDSAKSNMQWSSDYENYWRRNITSRMNELGYPQLEIEIIDGQIVATFDREAANQWTQDYADSLRYWHGLAEIEANKVGRPEITRAFLSPGTPEFDGVFNDVVSKKRTEGGTLFFDKSALYHAQGEYIITPGFAEKIRIGASGRLYKPKSEGTIFYDTAGVKISNFEFGIYGGIEKNLFGNKVRLQGTIRADKNENFDWLLSPAASILYKPTDNNYLRISFSSAIRNPTLADQYLNLNVGRAILSGNLNGVENLITVESITNYLETLMPTQLDYFNIAPVAPEKVRTIELGYRTSLFERLYVDAGYYYNIYNDFLGYNIGVDATFDPGSGFPTRLQAYRYSANSLNEVTTQGFSIGLNYYFKNYFVVSGNYSWNKLNTELDDPIIPAFNTPEHKYNLGLSARDIPFRFTGGSPVYFGFNINYKWIDGFIFEGSPQFTGFVPSYDLLDAQININVKKIHTTFKLGASNLMDKKNIQTYGGPRIGRLGYLSVLFDLRN
jgi:outer membrane receptor protein involved in Fe transport